MARNASKENVKMKKLILAMMIVAITGCDSDKTDKKAPKVFDQHSEVCIKGVTYYYITYSLALALNTDSKIIPCN